MTQTLANLYDPASSEYKQFLTTDQFSGLFGPTSANVNEVIAFALAHNLTVTAVSASNMLVSISGAANDVESAFGVNLNQYVEAGTQRIFYATDREPNLAYALPVWHVFGFDDYSVARSLLTKGPTGAAPNTTGSGPGGSFKGSDRRAAYYGGSLTGSGQALGLFEFDGYSLTDVQNYFSNLGQSLNVPINNVLVSGASANSDGDDSEQAVDIEEAVSMAPGLSQVRVYIAPVTSADHGGDTAIFDQVAQDNIVKQLSVSWSWTVADPSGDDPLFQKMAMQGQTIFVASGDSDSYVSNGDNYYPAEDANVTTVGGTTLTTSGPGGAWASEVGWGPANNTCTTVAGSGGGPSPDQIAIPTYQQAPGVINSANKGSTSYRNAPDVAAEGNCDNYACQNGSCISNQGGTSLAAPTWAGFTALMNQQALAGGQATLGFANPTFYAEGTNFYFHDITSGSNGAYNAVSGYDLVTGWGSPVPLLAPPTITTSQVCAINGKTTSCHDNVTITTSVANAKIYFTTNSSVPNSSSTLYTGQFSVNKGTQVNAIVVGGNQASSISTVAASGNQ